MSELPDPKDINAVYGYWLSTVFIVTSEGVGVPFLVGKEFRVEGPYRITPSQPPAYYLTPAKIHSEDGRFKGLFKTIKPMVADYNPDTGMILCSGGVLACPKIVV